MSPEEAARSSLYERAAGLVELLFENPSDPRSWARTLEALCRAIDPNAVAVLIGQLAADGPVFLMGHGIEMQRVSPDLLAPSPDRPPATDAPPDPVFAIPAGSAAFAAAPLYQQVLGPAGVAPGPGLCLALVRRETRITAALLVLSRDPSWRPRPEDRSLLELLAPYLIRAVRAGLALHEERSTIEALLRIFDALVLGVVLLDEKSEVSFVNETAARLLGVRAGLEQPGSAGVADRRRRTEALRALLRREVSEADAGPADRPLHIVSTPLHPPASGGAPDARFATALFLGDPGLGATATEKALAALFALTPAEERLALRLASGEALEEAAGRLGIRLSTARSVLRAVFEKTGTHRQADLVRLVLTLVGQVHLEPPRD